MSDHDGSTEHSISGGLRFSTGDPDNWHCLRRPGTRLHLGYLGNAGHLPCLAERASRFVRCGLEHAARQHRAHGVGFLSAVMAVGRYRVGSGVSPVFIEGGKPRYLGEKVMMKKTGKRIATAMGRHCHIKRLEGQSCYEQIR